MFNMALRLYYTLFMESHGFVTSVGIYNDDDDDDDWHKSQVGPSILIQYVLLLQKSYASGQFVCFSILHCTIILFSLFIY